MSAIRQGVRQVMAWLHGWTGLLLGWVLLVMCLAGTLSVFKPEISRWMRPEATATADRIAATSAAIDWLAGHAKGSTGWYLTAADDRANTIEATYDSGGGDYVVRALDPVTGVPVARETLGGEFFYRLHFELEMPYPWGRLLASIAALTMLTALITGIIAHRRIFRDFFTFRPRKGQRSWLDGHNALGVLAMPFHLMITFSGLLTLATVSMPWGIVANYGNDLVSAFHDLAPGAVDRPAAKKAAQLAPIAPMLREAERRFGAPFGRLSVENPDDAASVVTVYRSDAAQLGATVAEVSFDGPSGRAIGAWTEHRPAVQTYAVIYGLHMGRFASGLLRWLYFLGGAMLTLAVASGMVLWIVKRRERAPLSLANRVVERLNVGVIAGVPIGCAAFLWANRLLPLDLVGRPQQEVNVALGAAGLALIAGLVLPPRRGWAVLLTVLATLCLGAPLIGGGAGFLAGALSRGDAVLPVADLVLVVAGLALLAIVWPIARKPATVPMRGRRSIA